MFVVLPHIKKAKRAGVVNYPLDVTGPLRLTLLFAHFLKSGNRSVSYQTPGALREKLGGCVPPASQNPHPIYEYIAAILSNLFMT